MLKRAKAEAQSDKEAAPSGGKDVKELSQAVLNSSHQIWLAGLGAFSRAQQEGMKVFETLVQQGQQVETRTRRAAMETANAARGAAAEKAKEVQKMAGGTWDKLEQVFEDRVARALSKLGVYTQNDVKRLTERVDALSEAVNRLIDSSASPSARAPTPAAGSSSRKGLTRRSSAVPAASSSGAGKSKPRGARKPAGKRARGSGQSRS